ncbi:MAG: N-6 DNA methylase [Thermoleophilia bacterium]
MTLSERQTISASQIAELAGVGASAVSNWRKRHRQDFPKPVGTLPGGGDLFVLREVEEWLAAHGRSAERVDASRSIWLALNKARGTVPTETAVEIALAALGLAEAASADDIAAVLGAATPEKTAEALAALERKAHPSNAGFGDLGLWRHVAAPELRPIIESAFATRSRAERAEAFESVMAAGRRSLRRGAEHDTAEPLAALLVEMAAPLHGTVVDPAAGTGTLLLRAADASTPKTRRGLRLVGEDISVAACAIAQDRLRLHEIDADFRCADALRRTTLEAGMADIVLCDAPLGLRLPPEAIQPDDPRWIAGAPGRSGDFAWIQQASWLLKPGEGRAYVTSTTGSTFRGGREGAIRSELLRRGMVEAIVTLAAGSAGRTTQIPLVVWVLRRPEGGRGDFPLLVIDASNPASGVKDPVPDELRRRIVDALRRFRADPPGFVPEPGFAAAVSILDLLGPDAVMTPSRWVGVGESDSFIEDIASDLDALRSARRRLEAAPLPALRISEAAERRTPRRVRDLIADGHLELLRGVRIDEGSLVADGTPLLGATEVRLRAPRQRYLDPARIPSRAEITEPGDVVIIPVARTPQAIVETEGGRILAAPLVALRTRRGWLPPELLAAFVTSAHNARAVVGSTVPHVRVPDLEVPLLSEQEAAAALDALLVLQAQETSAETLATAARQTRERLIDGLGSGMLLPDDDVGVPSDD